MLLMCRLTLQFFKCVSSKSDLNKMDCNNLAIVIAPTIMPPPLSCPPQRMDYHLKLVKVSVFPVISLIYDVFINLIKIFAIDSYRKREHDWNSS